MSHCILHTESTCSQCSLMYTLYARCVYTYLYVLMSYLMYVPTLSTCILMCFISPQINNNNSSAISNWSYVALLDTCLMKSVMHLRSKFKTLYIIRLRVSPWKQINTSKMPDAEIAWFQSPEFLAPCPRNHYHSTDSRNEFYPICLLNVVKITRWSSKLPREVSEKLLPSFNQSAIKEALAPGKSRCVTRITHGNLINLSGHDHLTSSMRLPLSPGFPNDRLATRSGLSETSS